MNRKLAGGKLVLASHNSGKLKEIAALVAPFGIAAISAASLGLPEPAETEASFAGNARIKAHAAARGSGLPALADDSGLCIDALGGDPGVYTADWAETPEGRDWELAMCRAEDSLRAIGPDAPRGAEFVCMLAVAWPDGFDMLFEGRVRGHMAWPPRGALGFGFDPVFVPDGHSETFAEMAPDAKHAISHRAAAFALLQQALL